MESNFYLLINSLQSCVAFSVERFLPTRRSLICLPVPQAKFAREGEVAVFDFQSHGKRFEWPRPCIIFHSIIAQDAMTAMSDSGAIPFPTVYISPVCPSRANISIVGVSAASRGVRLLEFPYDNARPPNHPALYIKYFFSTRSHLFSDCLFVR